jgi:hypothetical protein
MAAKMLDISGNATIILNGWELNNHQYNYIPESQITSTLKEQLIGRAEITYA